MISFKSNGTFTSVQTAQSGEVLSATHPDRFVSMVWCFELIRKKNLGESLKTGGNNVVPFKKT
jgi:hypothetical protein|tara:strand:- start:108 stop:296 length:189 start_codon:yes stop_codon:yes gene_type:complete